MNIPIGKKNVFKINLDILGNAEESRLILREKRDLE